MKIEYDKFANALYIRLQSKERGRTVEINENLNLDLDEEGKVIGVEILNPDEYPLDEIMNPKVEQYDKLDAEIIELKTETAV